MQYTRSKSGIVLRDILIGSSVRYLSEAVQVRACSLWKTLEFSRHYSLLLQQRRGPLRENDRSNRGKGSLQRRSSSAANGRPERYSRTNICRHSPNLMTSQLFARYVYKLAVCRLSGLHFILVFCIPMAPQLRCILLSREKKNPKFAAH